MSAEHPTDIVLKQFDPALALLVDMERRRQKNKLIFIASESVCPEPVRMALATEFGNLYAEGYPPRSMIGVSQDEIMDITAQMALYRRYNDRRYYQGCDVANFVEALAQRRCAELFLTDAVAERTGLRPEDVYVNVQPMSGAAANNAVYNAFVDPGAIVMGMDLAHGGHLTHGSPVNRSGRFHQIIPYGVDPKTHRLDYDRIIDMARQHRPQMIIAGYTAYPWAIDWEAFRRAADAAGGATLLADIAHTAGLVVADVFPNPLGYADVVSCTTHKTICGPRGAVLLTTDPAKARKIDVGVFPGEQGGPHVHTIAAKAVCFGLAKSPEFRALGRRIADNAAALGKAFQDVGVDLAYGGTDSHLLLIDLKSFPAHNGVHLKAEVASRALDMAGLTLNKNTIPGDESATYPTGLRLGTTWVSQRGFLPGDMATVAGIVRDLLGSIHAFEYSGVTTALGRGKIMPGALEDATRRVAELIRANDARYTGADPPFGVFSAPAGPAEPMPEALPPTDDIPEGIRQAAEEQGLCLLEVSGARSREFLNEATTLSAFTMAPGDSADGLVLDGDGRIQAEITAWRLPEERPASQRFLLGIPLDRAEAVGHWFDGLSDGYSLFGHDDVYAKVDGPVRLRRRLGEPQTGNGKADGQVASADDERVTLSKSFFVGQSSLLAGREAVAPKRPFSFTPAEAEPRRTVLYEEHLKRTSKSRMVPFAGWVMPVWYEGIAAEHEAVRTRAGLFDVSHMGVLDVCGPFAGHFLDVVTTNSVGRLKLYQSHYTYMLDADGNVLDDMIIYRVGSERYIIVANAANAEKVAAFLQQAASGELVLDPALPARGQAFTAEVRDLKSPDAGDEALVDMAFQGPATRGLLEDLSGHTLPPLKPFHLAPVKLEGIDVVVSRTGYTGEEYSYELFVHPDRAVQLWNLLLDRDGRAGVVPAGLGARDSLRTEAGFPLYGHELAGPYDLTPIESGYANSVKLHKPFFTGRAAMIDALQSGRTIIRFRVAEEGTRGLKMSDPVVSTRGEVVGFVTSATFVGRQQIGLAVVPKRYGTRGTKIGILALGRGKQASSPDQTTFRLEIGTKLPIPEAAIVLKRFGLPPVAE